MNKRRCDRCRRLVDEEKMTTHEGYYKTSNQPEIKKKGGIPFYFCPSCYEIWGKLWVFNFGSGDGVTGTKNADKANEIFAKFLAKKDDYKEVFVFR